MTTTMTAGMAKGDGAGLYFERRGDGPPLLLITGGGGDAGYYSTLADLLAQQFTVLTYDRRGNSRSLLQHDPVSITLAGQSADALAVLQACGFTSARVFGNSGGAIVALDLAARHPEAVDAVVPHEPPLPRVLPDAADFLAVYDEIDRVLATDGWRAAFTLFQVRVGHLTAAQQQATMAVLLDPASVLAPGPHLELMTRVSGNWEYLTRFEMQSFVRYRPDLDRIAGYRVPVALAAGEDTIALARRGDLPDDPFHLPCATIADRLGAELATFPGGHLAPMEEPAAFAARLREVFGQL